MYKCTNVHCTMHIAHHKLSRSYRSGSFIHRLRIEISVSLNWAPIWNLNIFIFINAHTIIILLVCANRLAKISLSTPCTKYMCLWSNELVAQSDTVHWHEWQRCCYATSRKINHRHKYLVKTRGVSRNFPPAHNNNISKVEISTNREINLKSER